jgi:hypothetical protein
MGFIHYFICCKISLSVSVFRVLRMVCISKLHEIFGCCTGCLNILIIPWGVSSIRGYPDTYFIGVTGGA